ncbi:MAG: hypothetical protein KGD65_10645 [Candidatus Lokiarchaeota archaeon]|nr:hypothetical protein [Candidatus Lokiarchaeota archaeon]
MTPDNYDRNRNSRFDGEWDDYDDLNIPYDEEDDWHKEEEYDMWDDEEEDED